jgi:hypothetical protein
MEIIVMTPLCLAVYYVRKRALLSFVSATFVSGVYLSYSVTSFVVLCFVSRPQGYKKRRAWRLPLEICCATCQLTTFLLFVGTEIANGLVHVPADWNLTFSSYHLMYFW